MQLAPGDAEAIHQHAYFLLASGNLDAALKELERAMERDPISPVMNAGRSEVLYFLHRDDDAWAQVQRAIATHPDFALAHLFAIPIAGVKRHATELRAYPQRAAVFSNENPGAVEQLVRGFIDPAQRPAALRVLADQPDSPFFDSYASINWYCMLGDRAKAVDVLEAAIRAGRNPAFSAEAAWSPLFDPVRNDPRFVAILKAMNLPYSPKKMNFTHGRTR